MKLLKFNEFDTYLEMMNEARSKGGSAPLPSPSVFAYAKKVKKEDQLNSFIEKLPKDAYKTSPLLWKELENNKKHLAEFFDKIYSYTTMEAVVSAGKGTYSSGLGERLFTQEPKGLGRGELLLAWLIEDSKISGGGKSFDISYNNEKNKFEVKEYSSGNAAIRLGVKGKVTQFDWWFELVDTFRRLQKLVGTAEEPKFDFSKYFTPEYAALVNEILLNQAKWLTGEIGKGAMSTIKEFYELSSKLEDRSESDFYTNIIIRGPKSKPIEMSIEPKHLNDIGDGKEVTFKKSPEDESYTYILTELRRLRYVRNPELLDLDIQKDIDNKVVNKIPFVVFRPDGPHIETNFVFYNITGASIKIVERRLAKDATDEE